MNAKEKFQVSLESRSSRVTISHVMQYEIEVLYDILSYSFCRS